MGSYNIGIDRSSQRRFNFFLNNIKLNIGTIILDIGCSLGSLSNFLNEKNINITYVGLDVDKKSLNKIISKEGSNYIYASAEYIPIRKKTLNIIVLFEVLNFLQKKDFLFDQAYDSLFNQGKMILSYPNKEYFLNFFEARKISWVRNKIGTSYTKKEIIVSLQKKNFLIILSTSKGLYTQGLYRVLRLFIGLLTNLFPKKALYFYSFLNTLLTYIENFVDYEYRFNFRNGQTVFLIVEK